MEQLTKRLKKEIRLLFSILFLLSNYVNVYANINDNDSVGRAIGVLKGFYSDYSREYALIILHNAAINDTVALAMNALGNVYLNGIVIGKDSSKALYWFEQAGNNGYPDAYHNIGAIYKEGSHGFPQDLVKAYKAFEKGVEMNSAICKYDKGFMLYKGLGCKQNYTEAVDLFASAVNDGNSGAMYMLGLCYRNGYGIEQNEQKGLCLLNMAAKLGNKDASQELMLEETENTMENCNSMDFHQNMSMINDSINDLTLLFGDFEGTLSMYDWSGKYLLRECYASMTINRTGNHANGYFVFGTDTISYSSNILPTGEMRFENCYFDMCDRYDYGKKTRYRLENAHLDIWDNEINGKLDLYSLSQREPSRPIYLKLHRVANQKNINNESNFDTIYVISNPFKYQLEVRLNLSVTSNVKAMIFDKYGVNVWQQYLGIMEKGNQNVTLVPTINPGYYVLKLETDNKILTTIILKGE